MVVKEKEKFEKTRHVKNGDKFKKYTLRGEGNSRCFDRILSNSTERLTSVQNAYDISRKVRTF